MMLVDEDKFKIISIKVVGNDIVRHYRYPDGAEEITSIPLKGHSSNCSQKALKRGEDMVNLYFERYGPCSLLDLDYDRKMGIYEELGGWF